MVLDNYEHRTENGNLADGFMDEICGWAELLADPIPDALFFGDYYKKDPSARGDFLGAIATSLFGALGFGKKARENNSVKSDFDLAA